MGTHGILVLLALTGSFIDDLGDPDREVRRAVVSEAVADAAVAELRRALDVDDWLTRKTALIALTRIGEKADPAHQDVIELLGDPDPLVRESAARACGAIRPVGAALPDALAALLEDPATEVRAAAAESAGRYGAAALPPLVSLLADDEPAVRIGASNGLAAMGPTAAPAIDALIPLIREGAPYRVAYKASDAVVAIGEPAIPALADVFRANAWYHVSNCLRRIGPKGVVALLAAVPDGTGPHRRLVMHELREIDGPTPAAAPVLLPFLKSRDRYLRFTAAETLAHACPSRTEVLPIFIGRLETPAKPEKPGEEAHLYGACARALGKMGKHAVPAIPAIAIALRDPGVARNDKWSLISALAKIGPAALPRLETLYGESDAYTRLAAAEAALRIGPDAIPSLIASDLFEDESFGNPGTGQRLKMAVRKMGKAAFPVLTKLLEHADPRFRRRAAELLDGCGPAAVPALLRALEDTDAEVRLAAFRSLANTGARGWIEILTRPDPAGIDMQEFIWSRSPRMQGTDGEEILIVRLLTQRLLDEGHDFSAIRDRVPTGHVPDPIRRYVRSIHEEIMAAGKNATPAVIDLLTSEKADAHRLGTGLAWDLGESAAEAAPHLVVRVASKDPEVRLRAAQALGKMGVGREDTFVILIDGLRRAQTAPFSGPWDGVDHPRRERSIEALVNLGPKTGPTLLKALRDPDDWVRLGGAKALLTIDIETKRALAVLTKLLSSGDDKVRRWVLVILIDLEERAQPAAPAIIKALGDTDRHIRCAAVRALAKSGADDPATVRALITGLDDRDWLVTGAVHEALVTMGPKAAPAVPLLVKRLRNDANIPWICAVLGAIGPKARAAWPEVLAASSTRYRDAMQALVRIAPDKAMAPLLKALGEGNSHQRAIPMRLLAMVGKRAVPSVVKAMGKGTTEARVDAVKTLRNMGPEAAAAVPHLVKLTTGEHKMVAVQAVMALEAIGPSARAALPALKALPETKEHWWTESRRRAIRSVRGDLE